jgi:hypothetical protein
MRKEALSPLLEYVQKSFSKIPLNLAIQEKSGQKLNFQAPGLRIVPIKLKFSWT